MNCGSVIGCRNRNVFDEGVLQAEYQVQYLRSPLYHTNCKTVVSGGLRNAAAAVVNAFVANPDSRGISAAAGCADRAVSVCHHPAWPTGGGAYACPR